MTNWLPRIDTADGPRYLAIVAALEGDIRCGRLRPGDRLPTHRLLADMLGINVSTVTRAYHEAERRHLVGGEVGRGTYVLGRAEVGRLFAFGLHPGGFVDAIDLSTNMPALPPSHTDLARSIADFASERGLERFLDYQSAGDWLLLRSAAAQWMALRGVAAEPGLSLVTAGAQHALATLLGWLAGDTEIAVEAATYPGLLMLARERGWRLAPLAMDAEGVTPAAVDGAARAGRRILVLSPSLQNPTGRSMSEARRHEIAALARRHQLMIIEEDVYGLLGDPALPPLASLAPDHVCYLTGLSKTVAPGLRIGFVRLPPVLGERVADAEHQTSWYVAPLMAGLASQWITDGTAAARVAWQRNELVARWACVRNAGLLSAEGAPGPHLWLPQGSHAGAARFVAALESAGVRAVDGESFAVRPESAPAGVRISIGAAASRGRLNEALRRISGVQAELCG